VNRKIYALALLAAGVLALAAAGCGGGGSSSSAETSAETDSSAAKESEPVKAAPNAEEGTTFVSLGNVSDLGMVLVDSKGMTLYNFHKDQGEESSCYGECAQAWPPLLAEGEPQPSNGADASQLGTTERKDGTMQVTYAGHPLYGFVGDKAPGEANGNDVTAFGGEWYALQASGEQAGSGGGGEGTATEETEETEETSGGGYSGY
jgi:predicted lipoprotein with Yx(FWY)xxD motif